MKNKDLSYKVYWSIRITLGIFGIIAIYQIVPYFTELLQILVSLIKTTNATPEFKIILICISIWVTCSIFNVIVNLVFKLHSLLEEKVKNVHSTYKEGTK